MTRTNYDNLVGRAENKRHLSSHSSGGQEVKSRCWQEDLHSDGSRGGSFLPPPASGGANNP